MSTTVNYKGSTIATVTNATKTLNTAGTWVEGDIEIVDAIDGRYTAAISVTSTGMVGENKTRVEYNGQKFYTDGGMFSFDAGDTLTIYAWPSPSAQPYASISIDGTVVRSSTSGYSVQYTYTLPTHNININLASTSVHVTSTLQSKTVSYTPSETAQSATVTADSGYDGLSSVAVSVGAISSSYVGSGIERRSSSDLTASGATVTVQSGYYASQATKSVASGTEGTPTATKGSVSNHSVSVTPSVTNAAGYISGGTKTGTAVTVSASELVSGSETKTANGTYDVTNLASVVVNVPSSGGSTLGTKTIAENGTYSASDDGYDGYSSVTVNVPTGGSSGIKIGIKTTSIPNILNMFYALENGTATTGEFTLARTIPNTSTLIFDTGLSTVNGLFIADESQATLNTGTSPENTLLAIVFNPTSSTGTYAMTRLNIRLSYGASGGLSTSFINRVSAWEVSDGKFYATGTYNRHSNYTPFSAGHTYRWVAW